MRRVLLVTLILLGLGASPATAAPGDMEFSTDGGASWSTTPPSSLFDQDFRFVPGDTVTRLLEVRSLRSMPTVAMVAIEGATVDNSLYESALLVAASDEDGNGMPTTRLSALTSCAQVIPTQMVQAGEILSIAFTVSVSSSLVVQQAQLAVANFDLQLALTDVGAPTTPNGCPVDPAVIAGFPVGGKALPASIAYTGLNVVPVVLALTIALLVGGSLVAAGRRRREER